MFTYNRPWAKLPQRFSTFAAAITAIIIALTLAGCGGGKGNGSSTPIGTPTPGGSTIAQPGWSITNTASVQPSKAWTFLVYMDGANNLDTYALFNFNQLETVGSTSNVNIVVQFKRGQGFDANDDYEYDNSEGGWAGTRRYYVTKDSDTSNINSLLLSTNATADMGNWNTLQAFVQWGIQTYPAQHYALIVWDHGSGWRAEPLGSKSAGTKVAAVKTVTGTAAAAAAKQAVGRGVAFDDVSSDYILSTQLAEAIDMGNGKKWDLLAWDCSLMQMIENDYQIKDKVNYIVGSEESPPGGGYKYDTVLADLDANPTWDGKALGTDFANTTLAYYKTSPNIAGAVYNDSYITQSVIDASQLAAIAPAVNAFGAALSAAESQYSTQISLARAATEKFGVYDESQSDPTYEFYESYRDPVDFVHNLVDSISGSTPLIPASDTSLVSAANAARAAINAAIVVNVVGPSHLNAHGLALYIPTPSDYRTDDSDQASGQEFGYGTNIRYGDLFFSQAAPNWQSFLANATQ